MSQIRIQVDAKNLVSRQFTELERQQLPFATMQAINTTAFETRQRWSEVMPKIFDRPTPLTRRAVLYRKATKANPVAEVFIRDEAFKGRSPAQYLEAQVMGGSRPHKGVERQLSAAGILPAGMFVVPGRGAPLDAYGNIPLSQMNRIKAQIGAMGDPLANETEVSRGRRRRRAVKQGKRGGDFFALKKPRGRLAAGVYERITTGFGSAVRPVLVFVKSVLYRRRYPIFNMAQTIFSRRLPRNFEAALAQAVSSAWGRAFRP